MQCGPGLHPDKCQSSNKNLRNSQSDKYIAEIPYHARLFKVVRVELPRPEGSLKQCNTAVATSMVRKKKLRFSCEKKEKKKKRKTVFNNTDSMPRIITFCRRL